MSSSARPARERPAPRAEGAAARAATSGETGIRVALGRSRDVPRDDAWLSSPELAVQGRMTIAKRRADWRLGRWTAKRLVAVTVGTDAADARILAAPDGVPEVTFADGRPVPIVLSISHSSGRAFCAVAPSGTWLGCDVEALEPRSDAFVRDAFTEGEAAFVGAALGEERTLRSNLVWSAKESALKALRVGLRADTRWAEVVMFGVPDDAAGTGWLELELRIPRRAELGPGMPGSMRGWWRRDGRSVLTVVAEPAAGRAPESVPI